MRCVTLKEPVQYENRAAYTSGKFKHCCLPSAYRCVVIFRLRCVQLEKNEWFDVAAEKAEDLHTSFGDENQ